MPPKPQPVALRIELQTVVPLVWRRVIVPNSWTLASLHHYFQWVMGWQDSHAHEFHIGERVVAPRWWLEELQSDGRSSNAQDELRVSVASIATDIGIGGSFEYHYDMGDGWEHRITLETSLPAWLQLELPMPACTAGENACPPEDVGGPHGYHHFLQCIGDQDSGEYGELLRWVGGVFDPAGFDLNRVNRDWRGAPRKRR